MSGVAEQPREDVKQGNRPEVSRDAGPRPGAETGVTVWLTGLPSAGKSTIAGATARQLLAEGRRVQVLDGDELRRNLCADLGFSRADRDTNVRRIGWVARLLAAQGVVVLVPVIAPYEDSRAAVRAAHEEVGVPYLEVYVATPLEVCSDRDVKGLYARQRRGEISGLTGVDDPYETPSRPDLSIATHELALEACAALVATAVRDVLATPSRTDNVQTEGARR